MHPGPIYFVKFKGFSQVLILYGVNGFHSTFLICPRHIVLPKNYEMVRVYIGEFLKASEILFI